MSRKNVFWSVLLVLFCWASLVVPASAQHFTQVKGTLASVAAGRNEVFGIDANGAVWRYHAATKSFSKIPGVLAHVAVGGGTLSQHDDVWGINASGNVYRFNYSTKVFNQVQGVLRANHGRPRRPGQLPSLRSMGHQLVPKRFQVQLLHKEIRHDYGLPDPGRNQRRRCMGHQ